MKKKLSRAVLYLALLAVIVLLAKTTNIADIGDITHLFRNIHATTLIQLLVMVLFVLLISELAKMLLSTVGAKSHRAKTLNSLLVSLTKYATAIVILCWGLSIIGVDVSTILASVGLLALIIGFGAESLITDVITGIFMLFENQYNIGDIIEVNGFRGTVSSIGIRTISVIDTSGNVKILNNSELSNILNRSNNASKAVCDFSIPYSTDLEALEEKFPSILNEIYLRNKDTFISVPEYVGVQELGSSSVVLRFIADVPESLIYSGTRALNRELFLTMRKAGVECPFPQLDIHQ